MAQKSLGGVSASFLISLVNKEWNRTSSVPWLDCVCQSEYALTMSTLLLTRFGGSWILMKRELVKEMSNSRPKNAPDMNKPLSFLVFHSWKFNFTKNYRSIGSGSTSNLKTHRVFNLVCLYVLKAGLTSTRSSSILKETKSLSSRPEALLHMRGSCLSQSWRDFTISALMVGRRMLKASIAFL
jgi:hypothetical protein